MTFRGDGFKHLLPPFDFTFPKVKMSVPITESYAHYRFLLGYLDKGMATVRFRTLSYE